MAQGPIYEIMAIERENRKEGEIKTVVNTGQIIWSSQRGGPILFLVCDRAWRILYTCDKLYWVYIKNLKVWL